MTMRKTRKASWLLTVASAYSVLPGCSDDPAIEKADASMATYDGGNATPAPRKDAAAAADGSRAVIDTSSSGEVVDTGDDVDITTLIGVILFPPNEDLPTMDAGATDTPPATDASVANDASDVDVDFPVGVVVLPPDASVLPEGALNGIFVLPPRTVP